MGSVALVAATVVGSLTTSCRAEPSAPSAHEPEATTAAVALGSLSSTVSVRGTLAHRAGADGSPFVAINQASGTYTALPDLGATIACGGELYRVDDHPVLLLCGALPAYRDLRVGDAGNDVRQLNANLHRVGVDAAVGVAIDPVEDAFTERTELALEQLQRDRGAAVTGELRLGGAVVLPEPARTAEVTGELGGDALPGASVLAATSATLEVRVELVGSQQRDVRVGDRARVTLPSNASVTGTVDRVGAVARTPGAGDGEAGSGAATVAAAIALDDATQAHGLGQAPVQVEITTAGVDGVLSVPVLAIVGTTGGGYAVEVVREGGRRDLAAVELGLFDTTAGRVQVEGDVHEGDRVVVPSS